ncbi:MAG: hypothetical protein J7K98_03730 [Candidatus Aenigmarchaeota archaeon]|nr:hypothetical protein [Candidatus Aenigmarchaeota archaeon]
MKIVMKLGGSVVTFKDVDYFPSSWKEIKETCKEYIRTNNIKRIAKELKRIVSDGEIELILINGAGPFGHFLVREMLNGNKNVTPELVHKSVELLNKKIVETFEKCSIHLVSLAPSDFCSFNDGKIDSSKLFEKCTEILKNNKYPSTYGDGVRTDKVVSPLGNLAVISGDDLVIELAKLWEPDKIIVATDVDGVFTSDPKVHPDAKLLRVVTPQMFDQIVFDRTKVDVTGGMRSKVLKLFKVANIAECRIVNGFKENVIKYAIEGKEVGTLIKVDQHQNSQQ